MPASAWAERQHTGGVDISIDGKNYIVGGGNWEWVYNFPNKETVSGDYYVPDISFDSEDHVIYKGKYLTLDGSTPVVKTDAINSGYAYTTMAIPLDFTAPESLAMKVTQGHSDLAIDPCVITNTGTEELKLSQVEISAATGWTVVNASTDFTTADSKNKIAFTAGSHDFSGGAYTPNEKIAAGGNTTLQLAGKISEKADLTNATQVASMVLTVEKVEIIAFKIGGGSYQAEEGMTWAEWVESSYNTASCTITGDIHIYYPLGAAPGIICKDSGSNPVCVTDEIIAGTNYIVNHSGLAGN